MRLQPDGGVEHDAREAHAAGGGPEQVGILARRDPLLAAGRRDDRHGRDVVAPRAGAVVVLAVDVAGDGAADGDLARARA